MSLYTCKSNFLLYIPVELPKSIPAPQFHVRWSEVFHNRERLLVSTDWRPTIVSLLFVYSANSN